MNETTKKVLKSIALGVLCVLVALGCYWAGTWGRVGQSEYDDLRDERDATVGELQESLGRAQGLLVEAQGRAQSLVRGLGSALELARGSVDRNRRIELLVDAIDRAFIDLEDHIRELSAYSGLAGQGAQEGDPSP
ncbi:MAG: hypothetical protein WC489_08460 [Patescibacteria group bacterium]